jgi:peptidoglycan DL-endopeptidase CwlO
LLRRSAWCAPLGAALAVGAILVACVPSADAADSVPELRARAGQLRQGQAQLQRTEHGALLALYAAEASVARARAEQARLDARSAALARAELSLQQRAAIVRRSLDASRARVELLLRALYVAGDDDPLAAVLGAESVGEALNAIESLERATAWNRRLVAEARTRSVELRALQGELRARRAGLDAARGAAAAASARLEGLAAERRATVASIRRTNARAAARIDDLLAQARAAEQASERLQATSPRSAETTAPATTTAVSATAAGAPAGTRTLVVDAVAYHLPGSTASGLPVGPGVVAVDPNVIPLGTRLFIPGYGPGIAADTGSAIRGNIIDLWMPSTAAALRWGRRTVTITIYG